MLLRSACVAFALVLAGCQQEAAITDQGGSAQAPQLDAPAPSSEPSRVFAPVNDAARAATGELNVSIALRLPDAGEPGADAQDVITLRGANNVVIEGLLTGAISPATQVQGQTLRALLSIPVDEPQVLVYRVTQETRAEGVAGVCGTDAPAFVVVWEPAGPGEPVMKVLGVLGAAPGAAGARACPLLDYRRN